MKQKHIVYETNMTEIPQSCLDCQMYLCTLPCNARDNTKINEPYLKKRHKQCPLREV